MGKVVLGEQLVEDGQIQDANETSSKFLLKSTSGTTTLDRLCSCVKSSLG
jgi:hypothetical protein